ncbi:MAG: LysR substrate-binding domain-containing protein [Stappiaceae bacterium]
MAIKTEMLRCFVTVARSGNLADAAEKLGRTPSAVSMMLKQFEDHLGAALFESDRKSKLTALGLFTLDEASRELDHFERTIASIENNAHAKSGLVRIAVVPSVAETIMPEVVQEFLKDHPDVHVDIQDMDSAAVLREIERERVDLGIATGPEMNSEVESEELFSDAFGIVCRADHPLKEIERPLTWRDLGTWPFIANGICAQIADDTVQHVMANSRLMVRNTTSLLALVRAGIGITVLPRLVVGKAAGDVEFLAVADPLARRRIDILRRTHTSLTPVTHKFRSVIRSIASNALV